MTWFFFTSFTNFSPVFWRENRVPRFPRSHRLSFCHVCYSVFRITQSLFFLEMIFCMFCYSYTGIRIDGIVPLKERALYLTVRSTTPRSCSPRSCSTQYSLVAVEASRLETALSIEAAKMPLTRFKLLFVTLPSSATHSQNTEPYKPYANMAVAN